MSLWNKRKDSEKKRTPPVAKKTKPQINLPQLVIYNLETKIRCISQTDFQDKAEIVMFARMSPELPADLCRREGELQIDMRMYAEELQLIGIEPDTPEFTKAMTRIAKVLPAA